MEQRNFHIPKPGQIYMRQYKFNKEIYLILKIEKDNVLKVLTIFNDYDLKNVGKISVFSDKCMYFSHSILLKD